MHYLLIYTFSLEQDLGRLTGVLLTAWLHGWWAAAVDVGKLAEAICFSSFTFSKMAVKPSPDLGSASFQAPNLGIDDVALWCCINHQFTCIKDNEVT